MRLLHCSDLHLDAPMNTSLSPERRHKRRLELEGTFLRLLEEAERLGAVLLITGDLFDSKTPARSTVAYIKEAMREHPSVRILLIAGNHDETLPSLLAPLPEHVTLFAGAIERVSFPDCDIYGSSSLALTEEDYRALSFDEGRVNILMLHGTVTEGQTGSELIALSELRGKGLDYLALGHFHHFKTAPIDDRGVYAYAGTPEGRGFDECGPMGYVLYDTEDKSLSFRPFARRLLHDMEFDITPYETERGIEASLLERVRALPCEDMLHVTLTGTHPAALRLDPLRLSSALSERFYAVRLRDRTRLALKAEDYLHDKSLKGEFIRLVMAEDLPEERKSRIIRAGLEALRGEVPEG